MLQRSKYHKSLTAEGVKIMLVAIVEVQGEKAGVMWLPSPDNAIEEGLFERKMVVKIMQQFFRMNVCERLVGENFGALGDMWGASLSSASNWAFRFYSLCRALCHVSASLL